MNPDHSSVSVILPVLNGERYLASAIESVQNQSLPPEEILVVDGNSDDRSREIAESSALVRLLTQDGKGLSNAWNYGIRQAAGDLIAFIESDDLWVEDKLSQQIEHMKASPSTDYVIGRVHFFLEKGNQIPTGFKPELLEGDYIGRIPGTLMARKSLFDDVGLFDESLKIAADVDWFARCKDLGSSGHILGKVLLEKRVHSDNLSNNAARNTNELLSLLRRSIERQRNTDNGGS